MSIFEDIYNTISGFFNWLSSIGGGLRDNLGELGAWLQGGLGWLGERLQSGIVYYATQIYNAFSWIGTKFVEAYETLANWLEAGLEWISSGLSWIGSKILEGVQWIYNGILWLWDNLVAAFQALVNWIIGLIANAWNTIVGFGNAFVNSLNSFFTNWIKRLREKLISLFTVNIALHGMRISYEKLMEQPSLKNLVSMFSAPIISAVAGALLDAITPKPQSETVYVYLPFELPFWDISSLTLPRVPERPAPTPIEYLKPSRGGYKPIIEIPLKIGSSSEPIIQLPSYKLLYLKLGAEAEGYLPPFIPVELPLKLAETYEMPTGLQELNITNYLLSRNVSGTESQEWYDIYLLLGNRTDKQLPTTSTIDIVNRIYSATSQATPEQELLDILLNLGATNYKDLLTPTTIDIANTALGTQAQKLHSLYKSDAFLKLKETYSLSSSMLPGYSRPSGLGIRIEKELDTVPTIKILGTLSKGSARYRGCLSADGSIAYIPEDINRTRYISKYSTEDFSLISRHAVNGREQALCVTPDGQYLLTGDGFTLYVRDPDDLSLINYVSLPHIFYDYIYSVRMSFFHNRAIMVSETTVYIVDIPSLSYTSLDTGYTLCNADFVYYDSYIATMSTSGRVSIYSYPSLTLISRKTIGMNIPPYLKQEVAGNPTRPLIAVTYYYRKESERFCGVYSVPDLTRKWYYRTTGSAVDRPYAPSWNYSGDFLVFLGYTYALGYAGGYRIYRFTGQPIASGNFSYPAFNSERLYPSFSEWKPLESPTRIWCCQPVKGDQTWVAGGYGIVKIQII